MQGNSEANFNDLFLEQFNSILSETSFELLNRWKTGRAAVTMPTFKFHQLIGRGRIKSRLKKNGAAVHRDGI